MSLLGATTAGEITGEGYVEGEAVAIGLSGRHFAVETFLIRDLGALLSIGQQINTADPKLLAERLSRLSAEGNAWREQIRSVVRQDGFERRAV